MINVDIGAAWRRTLAGAAATALAGAGLLAVAGPAAADGNTVYVNPDGFDSPNCGRIVQQCLTIQKGVDQAEAGDTVKVAPGTYTGPVRVTKAITLQGDGSTIDGTGVEYGPDTSALVTVNNPGGNVTVDGFTIENAPHTDSIGSIAFNYIDTTAADVLTFTHNVVSGDPSDPDLATAGQIGFNSSDTAAHVVIQDSKFSGLFQGILLEGVSGPVDVSSNVFEKLDTVQIGDAVYPGEGVYILSDKGTAGTDQDIVGNTFRDYGGIGIAVSAGYDFGGCSGGVVCNGSVTGSVSNNTFDLTANDADVEASAIRLRAKYEDNALNLTIGGNTGGVAPPTKTITESATDGGTITVTPGSSPNTIVPTPAPTLAVAVPASVTTAEDPTDFTGAASVPEDGAGIAHARYDIAITGASGISADQIKLEYAVPNPNVLNKKANKAVPLDGTYQNVPLTGTTADGGTITGYFGPQSGFSLPAGATNVTNFRISVPSATAPAGALSVKISLVEVSQGTGNPALNTQATDTDSLTVVANSKPTAAAQSVSTPVGTAKDVVLASTDADDDAITFAIGQPAHGTAELQEDGKTVHYVPADGYVGTDSFTYTADDGKAGPTTGTVTIAVGMAAATFGTITVSPTAPTSGDRPSVTVPVSSTTGSVEGGLVTLKTGTVATTTKVVNGRTVVVLPQRVAATYTYTVTFGGTATVSPASTTLKITVSKVTSSITYIVTSPSPITTATAKPQILVTVAAPKATVAGGTVTISTTTGIVQGTAKVGSDGIARVTVPKLPKGPHSWKATFAGTTTASTATRNFNFISK